MIIEPSLAGETVVGYFDGDAQQGVCGGGIYKIVNANHNYAIWMGFGSSTNTRVESLDIWGLPYLLQILALSLYKYLEIPR